MESTVPSIAQQAESIQGGNKWMLLLGWSCFVGIAAIILADLVVGIVRHLVR